MSDQPLTNIVNDAINATKPLVKLVAMAEAAAISVVTDKKDSILLGFALGCNPIESLFLSTLSCFYNQICVQLINFKNLSFIDPLDISLRSHYYPTSTVDDWFVNVYRIQIFLQHVSLQAVLI
ncbi:hypothetical protein I4U23_004918 [Adineta vaga]|nr:hypothetical protein I4U23_004918 [Adineta vaga]